MFDSAHPVFRFIPYIHPMKQKRLIPRSYYLCQLCGWGLLFLLLCSWFPQAARTSGALSVSGLAASHVLWLLIMRNRWWRLPAVRLGGRMVGTMAATCVAASGVRWGLSRIFTGEWLPASYMLGSALVLFLLLFGWSTAYCCLHFMRESARRAVRIRLLREQVELFCRQSP